MSDTLESIQGYLTVLGLSTNKVPTLAEYKKAYRGKLVHHPDKGGDGELFKSITEAAHHVFSFITDNHNQHNKPESESETDKGLIRAFESSNNVKYSTGNVVFNIDTSKADLWIQCLRKKLGTLVSLDNKTGVKMKVDDFKIPLVSCHTKTGYGAVCVTVWPSPSDGQAKVCVQGKMHLAFISFVLPAVIRDVESGKPEAIGVVGGPAQASMACLDSDEEVDDDATADMDIGELRESFKRMENEVVILRKDLVQKVELAVVSQNKVDPAMVSRLDMLEKLVRETIEQNKTLTNSLDQLKASVDKNKNTEGNNSTMNTTELDKVAQKIIDHDNVNMNTITSSLREIRSEIENVATKDCIANEIATINHTLVDIKNTTESLVESSEGVQKNLRDFRSETAKEVHALSKNSDSSLNCLQAMKTSLEKLVLQHHPSNSLPSSSADPSVSLTATNPVKIKKGIMFSCSIGKDIDLEKLKDDLKCDIKLVTTNNVEENPEAAKDLDVNLHSMVSKHLAGSSEFDFVIIATGADAISSLDTESSPPTTLFTQVQEQSTLLVEVAQNIVNDMKIDVFIIENPPRYDQSDPTAMKQKLSKYSNGVVSSNTGPAPRIYLVEQSGLARSSQRARSELYKSDGIHLTQKGLRIFANNIANSLRECYVELGNPSTNTTAAATKQMQVETGDRYSRDKRYRDDRSRDRRVNQPDLQQGWPGRGGDHHHGGGGYRGWYRGQGHYGYPPYPPRGRGPSQFEYNNSFDRHSDRRRDRVNRDRGNRDY